MNTVLRSTRRALWRDIPAAERARLVAVGIERERSAEHRAIKAAEAAIRAEADRKRQTVAKITAGVLALRRKESAA